jgi:hypothetical protein
LERYATLEGIMDRYWAKIGFGALAVFGVGFVGVTLARKGVAQLKTVAVRPARDAIREVQSKLLNFRLDGRRLGYVRSIDVSNEGDWSANSVEMTVQVEAGREPADLGDCLLATETLGHRRDASFRCVDQSEVGSEGLVQIGEVQFEPAGITRPLYVADHQMRQLERSELRGIKANLTSSDGKSVKGSADFDIETRHGRRERGTVKIDAGDGGAVIEVRGADGQELFSLKAGDHGVSINAKDKRGSNLLRLLAGESGVHLNVTPEKDQP